LAQDNAEEAQRVLDRLTFEAPLERMALDTQLLRVDLNLKRKEYLRAFATCQALLPLAEKQPQESQVLYCFVESGLALGKTAEAQRVLRRLVKEFPYSEGAAKGKALWERR
jgi:TolA-binding protein